MKNFIRDLKAFLTILLQLYAPTAVALISILLAFWGIGARLEPLHIHILLWTPSALCVAYALIKSRNERKPWLYEARWNPNAVKELQELLDKQQKKNKK